jgi:hypothetical protein
VNSNYFIPNLFGRFIGKIHMRLAAGLPLDAVKSRAVNPPSELKTSLYIPYRINVLCGFNEISDMAILVHILY